MTEALLVFTFITAFAPSLLFTMYLGVAKIWLDHVSEEILFCLASQKVTLVCQTKYTRYINSTLPVGQIKNFKATQNLNQAKVEIHFTVGTFQLSNKKTLKLPLSSQQI